MSNTAAPEFREVKKPQGGAHVRPANLFRLDQRTVISEFDTPVLRKSINADGTEY